MQVLATEIDDSHGYTACQGKLVVVDMPFNAEKTEDVKQIKAGKRKIGRDNFDDPVFKDF